MSPAKKLSAEDEQALLKRLKVRFSENLHRHGDFQWADIQARLADADPYKLWSLNEMERTGGEPDVMGRDPESGAFIFFDCSKESPKGRRSLCYDREGWESRKKHKPENNAIDKAAEMEIELLTEEEYRKLQEVGKFDTKTSSWLKTPAAVRKQGGAIFGDFRYGRVFIYHNGAQSYYAARGFRGSLKI